MRYNIYIYIYIYYITYTSLFATYKKNLFVSYDRRREDEEEELNEAKKRKENFIAFIRDPVYPNEKV